MRSLLLAALLAACVVAQDSSQKLLEEPSTGAPAPDIAPSWRDDLLSLHRSLIEIESISGNENAVGQFLVEYLTGRGYAAQLQFVPPEQSMPHARSRFNVMAWRGEALQPRPRVIVSSHIDVVPPHIPYSISDDPPTSDTMISGRGSVDAKASVAAQIMALEDLYARGELEGDGPNDDVMLLFVVSEETTGDGMKFFSSTMKDLHPAPRFDAVIFGEPTENKLACGHKGAFGCVLEARGQAGHSGYPWLGKSANELVIRALAKLLETDLGSSDDYGNTTFNIGLMDGGVAANVIPAHARAVLSMRVAIGPEVGGSDIVAQRIRDVVDGVDSEAFDLSCSPGYGVVQTNCDVEGTVTLPR
jgi:acetylornithine deacetylase